MGDLDILGSNYCLILVGNFEVAQMRIVGMRLTNYGRFRGVHELDLVPGVYAVVARYVGAPQRSNWGGKSTLLSAVRWALYGELPDQWKTLDAAISRGEKEFAVDVELSDGTFITRSKKFGQSAQLKVNVPNGNGGELEKNQDLAQVEINERIGLGSRDFEYTFWLGQKNMAAIVTDDPAARTKVIVDWFSLGPLERAAVKVMKRINDNESHLLSYKRRHEEETKRCEGDREPIELKEQLASQELETERLRIENQAQAMLLYKSWEDEARRHIEVNRVTLAQGQLENQEPRLPLEHWREFAGDKHRTSDANLFKLDAEKSRLRKLLGGEFDGMCPVTCGLCPVPDKVLAAKSTAQAAYETADREQARYYVYWNTTRRRDRYLVEAHHTWMKWKVSMDRSITTLQTLEAQLTKPVLDPEPPAVVEQPSQLAELNTKVANAKAALLAYDTAKGQIEGLNVHIKKREFDLKVLRIALQILGKGGAQRRIATRSLGEIERIANLMLARRNIDLQVSLVYGREYQEIAAVCSCGHAFPRSAAIKQCEKCGLPRGRKRDDRLYISLSYVSGAAEDLAGIAVQLAAARWKKAARGTEWSVLAIDEPFGSCDRHNRMALAQTLSDLAGDGFEQLFCVAHNDDVLDALPHRITIIADGDWSTVEVA